MGLCDPKELGLQLVSWKLYAVYGFHFALPCIRKSCERDRTGVQKHKEQTASRVGPTMCQREAPSSSNMFQNTLWPVLPYLKVYNLYVYSPLSICVFLQELWSWMFFFLICSSWAGVDILLNTIGICSTSPYGQLKRWLIRNNKMLPWTEAIHYYRIRPSVSMSVRVVFLLEAEVRKRDFNSMFLASKYEINFGSKTRPQKPQLPTSS